MPALNISLFVRKCFSDLAVDVFLVKCWNATDELYGPDVEIGGFKFSPGQILNLSQTSQHYNKFLKLGIQIKGICSKLLLVFTQTFLYQIYNYTTSWHSSIKKKYVMWHLVYNTYIILSYICVPPLSFSARRYGTLAIV